MKGLVSLLKGRYRGDAVVRECRHCGTSVSEGDACPNCGREEIATYEFD